MKDQAGAESQALIAGRYRVLKTLGSGGMGVVYHAVDTALNKEVAVKTLRGVPLNPNQILRFQQEAVALSNLKHPSIVEVLIFGLTDENLPYLVMNYVEGTSLAKLIESRGYIPAYKSVNLFIELCDGLSHAHRHGVLHRDLKPANVMVNDPDSLHPKPIVVDFGIARVEGSSQSLTRPGAIIGTPAYMSPEQLKGLEVDARSDVYSVGCMMYETLTGVRLFQGENELETMSKKLEGEFPRLCEALPDLDFPEALEMIVAKSIAERPDDRYQSIDDLKSALLSLKAGELTTDVGKQKVSLLSKIAPSSRKSSKKSRKKTAVIVSVVLLLGIAVSTPLFHRFLETPRKPNLNSTMERFNQSGKEVNKYLNEIDILKYSVAPSQKGVAVSVEAPIFEAEITEEKLIKELKRRIKNQPMTDLAITNIPITGSKLFASFENEPIGSLILRGLKIDAAGIKALSKIQTVKLLRIEQNPSLSKEALAPLLTLPKLTQLALMNCDLDLEKIKPLSSLELTYFEPRGNPKVDVECLKYIIPAFPKLNALDISDTRIKPKDFHLLASIKSLAWLSIQGLDLNNEALNEIPDLPYLNTLLLGRNFNIDDSGINTLARFKSLRCIGICETKVTKPFMAKFSKEHPGIFFSEAP